MTVMTQEQITLSSVTDIMTTCRYYLLQGSALTAPTKPTIYPPASTWVKTEPSYTPGSANSLYFVDCTLFSDETFAYTDVSMSSAYEASKVAYAKAVEASNAANNAVNAANNAVTVAGNANTSAQSAATQAAAASQAAQQAQSEAETAKANAATAKGTADDAKAKAEAAQGTISNVQAELKTANDEIDGLGESLKALSNTMNADYAKKGELTDVQSSLQTQITQNAGQITSTATKLTEVEVTANDAAEQVIQAKQAAQTAQNTADLAKTNAANAASAAQAAQKAADDAQDDADAAAQAASDAQAGVNSANADLALAKANLASVTSRVDATEEEIEAAQAAVTAAQTAADAANAAATTAQSTANTAKTNAATAQTAANNAKTAADNAQSAANIAKQAADAAQASADALANRVTTAETKITQNSEAIALRATKTEVAKTLEGYYTATETEAAITTKAGEITSEVSANYTKKTDFNNLQIGGRNLLFKSKGDDCTNWIYAGTVAIDAEKGYCAEKSVTTTSENFLAPPRTDKVEQSTQYTFSCDVYVNEYVSSVDVFWLSDTEANKKTGNAFVNVTQFVTGLKPTVNKWQRITKTFTTKSDDYTGFIRIDNNGSKTSGTAAVLKVANLKLEKGNKATDWTPAPEDMATEAEIKELSTRVTQTEQSITSQATSIGSLGERTSTLEQTAEGFTASLEQTNTKVTNAQNAADNAAQSASDAQSKANAASSTANTAKTTAEAAKKQLYHSFGGTSGTKGYVAFAKLVVSKTYMNRPILFTVNSRGRQSTNVSFALANASSNDPALSHIQRDGGIRIWAYKADTSTWYLIANKGEAYDNLYVTDFTNNNAGVAVEWINVHYNEGALPTSNITEATQLAAKVAKSTIDNAAKTATNYLNFSSAGLIVGDMTASTLGNNVLIDSSTVKIRTGETILASFGSNLIELGKNNRNATIDLCAGLGTIKAGTGTGSSLAAMVIETTGTEMALRSSGIMEIFASSRNGTNDYCFAEYYAESGMSYFNVRAHSASAGDIGVLSISQSSGKSTATILADTIRFTRGSVDITDGDLTLNKGSVSAAGSVYAWDGMTTNCLELYSGSTQAEAPYIYWSDSFGGKEPYIGYAKDQNDGTFLWSITGTNYASGLAIGGGSGNLLWKGNRVLTVADLSSIGGDYLPLSGGNITGHIYLTGAKPSSSTGNTSQLIFGTASDQHLAITSNDNALVLNPTATSTSDSSAGANQIVLYLTKASVFPKGIQANVTGNLTGTASKATADANGNNIASTYASKDVVTTMINNAIGGAMGAYY